MQTTSTHNISNSSYTLEQRNLTFEDKNEIFKITAFASEYLKLSKLPVCEVFQLPNLDTTIHIVIENEAQKLIQIFHRYGPSVKNDDKFCPFSKGSIQNRYIRLLGEGNLGATFEEKSLLQRNALISFFTDDKLERLKTASLDITENWVQNQIEASEVYLFDACHHLVAEFLIKELLGFHECTSDDIYCSTEFWKHLFAHKSTDLKTVEEFENEEQINFFNGFFKDLSYLYSGGSNLLSNKNSDRLSSFEINNLCLAIYKSTISKETSLTNHLSKQGMGQDDIIENIKGLLLAGGETTGNLLGFILYEYAKDPNLQVVHVTDEKKISLAYLEALRLYSVRGSLREASENMVLGYLDQNGNKKEHYIRRGDLISTSPMIAGYNSTKWDSPEIFNPERDNLTAVKDIPHFGSGWHQCIGEKIAEMQIISSIDEILSYAVLTTKELVTPVVGKYTLRPKDDLLVKFSPRQ